MRKLLMGLVSVCIFLMGGCVNVTIPDIDDIDIDDIVIEEDPVEEAIDNNYQYEIEYNTDIYPNGLDDPWDSHLSDVTVCVSREGTTEPCEEVLTNVEEMLPSFIEDFIADYSYIELVDADEDEFADYMYEQPVQQEFIGGEVDYLGITTTGYGDGIMLYAMNDEYVLLHELGHAYDFANLHVGRDLVSNDPEFIACYYNEYISDYGETSEQEFFAEAFALYFGSPKYLKDNAPRTFNYMQYQFGLYEE